MKILHIGPKNYPPAHGGVEKIVFDISKRMNDFKSFFLVEWDQAESEFVKVLPRGLIPQFNAIIKFYQANSIDILHFHKETFIPHALYASLLRKKTVITFHGLAWRIKRWPWYYRTLFYVLDLLACVFIPNVIFVGKNDYQHFSKIIFWKKMFYIPNGIEINKLYGVSDVNKCVFIGRVSPEKNILNLVNMFGDNKKTLDIFGPFDKHDNLYCERVNLAIEKNSNVTYKGALSHTEILSTLAKYNTFYNISFSEGMPVSVLEAASVGLNLVLSDIQQHKDLAFKDVKYVNPYVPIHKHNFNGISIKNKIYVEENYSIQKTIEMYRNVYLKLITK